MKQGEFGMDVKDKKKFINRLFEKGFYNDNSKFKRKLVDMESDNTYEDREVLDKFIDNKRSFEEY